MLCSGVLATWLWLIGLYSQLGIPTLLTSARTGTGIERLRAAGVNFEGPAPRPLERWSVSIAPDDGQLIVDKSRKFQKELGQWTDSDSFIKV